MKRKCSLLVVQHQLFISSQINILGNCKSCISSIIPFSLSSFKKHFSCASFLFFSLKIPFHSLSQRCASLFPILAVVVPVCKLFLAFLPSFSQSLAADPYHGLCPLATSPSNAVAPPKGTCVLSNIIRSSVLALPIVDLSDCVINPPVRLQMAILFPFNQRANSDRHFYVILSPKAAAPLER